ncbi:MAG: hypothetical protein CBE49_000655 [Rickettsiales bacterium TMED289]|nr:MAG: hypothetical protein CBE49_000655 [Rickettsiales bacterium TMED289]|tara:strand:- start:3418 stop:5220 length:1803 start_codon:yes stop_codon:yes gene_type:complete
MSQDIKLISSIVLFFIISLNLSAQDIDPSFLDSLPDDVAKKLEQDLQDQEDVEVLFRGNTSIEGNKAILKKIQNQVDSLKVAIEGSSGDSALPRFGENFFSSIQSSFSPINLPNISDDYVLDYGDELTILLTGSVNEDSVSMVQRDGSILVGNLTKVFVRGLQLDKAAEAIQASMETTAIGVKTSTTLSGLRDIQVFLLGEVSSPGLYTLSGASNVLHALNVAGGISNNGSYRKIEHKRNNQVIVTLDLYQVMAFGRQPFSSQLRSGDIIFVNPKGFEVPVSGGVSRNALYEMLANETANDAIKFAGDISPYYLGNHFILKRFNEGKINELQINLSQSIETVLKPRDSITLPFYTPDQESIKTVQISGMVANPGTFNISDGERLSSIVKRAGGYKPLAYPYGSALFRENAKTLESNFNDRIYRDTLNFIVSNPQEVGGTSGSLSLLLEELKNYRPKGRVVTEFELSRISNNPVLDTVLSDGDIISVPPLLNQVYLFGEFNQPGSTQFHSNFTLDQYIQNAGGMKDTSTKNLIIIDPNGKTHFYKKTFFKPFSSEPAIYPGSIIYVSRDIGRIEGVKFAATFAPILSSLAISLASLNSIND